MFRLRTITLVTVMVAALFCYISIAAAESTREETRVELPKLDTSTVPKPEIPKIEIPGVSTKNKDDKEERELDERRTFDFSLPGDNRAQSLALFFELPLDAPPLEFKKIEGKLSGNYYLTFEKPTNLPKNLSFWESLQREYSEMKAISESYAFHLEVSTPGKLGVGGYIEIEGDMSIEADPRLHTTLYGEYKPWDFVEVAFGGWTEILRLGKERRENERLRAGFRTHCDIELKFKYINFSMLIEYLPHWNFKSYRLNTSPEIEFKLHNIKIPFKKDKFSFSLVLMGEVDYYSENNDFTIDPLFEINPWEIRWTQLIRHRF